MLIKSQWGKDAVKDSNHKQYFGKTFYFWTTVKAKKLMKLKNEINSYN